VGLKRALLSKRGTKKIEGKEKARRSIVKKKKNPAGGLLNEEKRGVCYFRRNLGGKKRQKGGEVLTRKISPRQERGGR